MVLQTTVLFMLRFCLPGESVCFPTAQNKNRDQCENAPDHVIGVIQKREKGAESKAVFPDQIERVEDRITAKNHPVGDCMTPPRERQGYRGNTHQRQAKLQKAGVSGAVVLLNQHVSYGEIKYDINGSKQ